MAENRFHEQTYFWFQIIRRSGLEEKYLCVVRQRPGHFCETACIIAVLVAWEGVPQNIADDLYQYLRTTLPTNGFETERRCGTNERCVKIFKENNSWITERIFEKKFKLLKIYRRQHMIANRNKKLCGSCQN